MALVGVFVVVAVAVLVVRVVHHWTSDVVVEGSWLWEEVEVIIACLG